jgi:poly-gamma-glutamate synthesis protein (capsule biosynthesis protein)
VLARISILFLIAPLGAGCSGSSSDATGAPPAVDPEAVEAPADPAAEDPATAPTKPAKPATSQAPATPAVAPSLELTFVGDVIFGRYRASGFDPIPEDGHDPFELMRDAMASDLLVGNLETPLVEDLPDRSPIGSRFAFGASREHAQLLEKAGFGAMSLANNHWYDQRVPGLEQSPTILEDLGIVPLGRTRPEGEPLFVVDTVEVKGWRIGFVAVTTRSNAPQRTGIPQLPFLDTRDMASELAPVVRAARADHDLVAVFVHWGDEYADAPALVQTRAARALVDAGADFVIGHHPHVLQGIERHGDGLIAYSLGNFVFENTNDPPRLTGVLRVQVARDPRCLQRVVFHPAYIKRNPIQHPVPATGFMHGKVTARMIDLSRRFGTQWAEAGDDLSMELSGCSPGAAAPAPTEDPSGA